MLVDMMMTSDGAGAADAVPKRTVPSECPACAQPAAARRHGVAVVAVGPWPKPGRRGRLGSTPALAAGRAGRGTCPRCTKAARGSTRNHGRKAVGTRGTRGTPPRQTLLGEHTEDTETTQPRRELSFFLRAYVQDLGSHRSHRSQDG